MTAPQPRLSLIIPVYNEVRRLTFLPKIISFLETVPIPHELIIVDDGSTDDTLLELRQIQKNYHFLIISYQPNRGKGHAIMRGMLQATGHWRGFMDLDLSVPLSTIFSVLKQVSKAPIIIGTRRQPGAQITQPQPKIRETLGRIFTQIAKHWLQLPVSDFTCGFKFFRQDAAVDIFSKMKVERWSFDPELLFIAHHRGWKIHQLPVNWHNDARTKVKFPQDALSSLYELALIRVNHWLKQY